MKYPQGHTRAAWRPVGPDACADPLGALARAEIPAILLPQVCTPADCQRLMERFAERGLLRAAGDERTRIDIGTSLGNLGGDQEAFLADAEETHALFATLFAGLLDPGDLYFFNTRCIHEVPAVQGDDPRVVLAVFIGYAEDDDEIYVWS